MNPFSLFSQVDGGTQIALALTVTGVLIAAHLWLIRQRRASEHWPTVDGAILSSRIICHPARRADGDDRVELRVRYRYRLRGQDYQSERMFWGGNIVLTTPASTDPLLAKYPEGGAVKVYYDPDKPEVAVLDPVNHAASGRLMGFILLAMVLDGYLLWTHFAV